MNGEKINGIEKIVIYGAGIFAETMIAYIELDPCIKICGVVVDEDYLDGRKKFGGYPLIGANHLIEEFSPKEYKIFTAIGYSNMNRVRQNMMQRLREYGYRFYTYIDQHAIVNPKAKIGENCAILENAIIQPYAQIKDGAIVQGGTLIGHHSTIGECVFASLNVTVLGCVEVGNNSFLGGGCTIINGCKVEEYTLVGAAAYINRNTKKYGMYKGKTSENELEHIQNADEIQNNVI